MKNCTGLEYFLKIAILVLIWINESSYILAAPSKLSDNMLKMKAVKDKILNGYDKTIRPTLEGSNSTVVSTAFMPRQILEVDEERALFIMDSYFYIVWIDPRLAWNSTTEYNGYLQLPSDLLWKPDLSVYNSHSLQVNPMQEVLLIVTSAGGVYWFPPVFTQTSCPSLSEVAYPNEVVTCLIQFGSWTHDGWEIDFKHFEKLLYIDRFLNFNPRWELIVSDAKFFRNETRYEGYDEPYVSLDYTFPIKRRMPPEIESTRQPCILVMLLTLSIFWLPANSSKKVLLGCILFLAITVLLAYVACSTKFPLGVVFAVSFLQSTMYIVVITLLLQILVISNVCNITGPVRPPPFAMQLLTGPFGIYACLRSSSNDNFPIDRMQLKEDSPNMLESPTPRDDWMLFAAGLDRIFFILMSIAMVAVHHL